MVLQWETCRTLSFELSNEQTVVMNQQPECNAHTEEHVIRTDLTKLGATVVSLVQIFLRGFFFKEDALHSLTTATTFHWHAILLLFQIVNVGAIRIKTKMRQGLRRRHGCQVELGLNIW